jgi:hypothetical protein
MKSSLFNAATAVLALLLVSACVSNSPRSDQAEAAPQSAPRSSSEKPATVKGLNGWEGEISGTPAANSRFKTLEIGMSMRQATDIAGQPTDQGAYVTGKAWIPFYFGSDRHRFEMVYRGQGRLVFAGGSLGNFSGGNLIMIINNDKEGGYR